MSLQHNPDICPLPRKLEDGRYDAFVHVVWTGPAKLSVKRLRAPGTFASEQEAAQAGFSFAWNFLREREE